MIAQLLVEGAGFYEQKCQRLDAITLGEPPVITYTTAGERLLNSSPQTRDEIRRSLQRSGVHALHVYAPKHFRSAAVSELFLPYVSRFDPAPGGLFRRTSKPARHDRLPEAVENEIFDWPLPPKTDRSTRRVIGSLHRSARGLEQTELTFSRLSRFRDDLDWNVFDAPPQFDEMREIDLWADVAVDEDDYDGWTAEAMVVGVPVVATRTAKNAERLLQGKCGTLVRMSDPNELAHAIVNVLFKEEIREPKREAAREESDRFHAEHRARALRALHEDLLR